MENKKLKILVVSPTFLPYVGGAELGIHEIYKRIGKSHDVHILTPYLPNEVTDGLQNDYKIENYKVYNFKNYFAVTGSPVKKLFMQVLSLTAFFYILAIIRHLGTFKPDVINFHYALPEGVALVFASKILKIPTVLSLVGRPDVFRNEISFFKKIYLFCVVNSASYVLPITNYCLTVPGISTPRKVIPYGVDINEFKPDLDVTPLRSSLGIPEGSKVLFTVQRLIRLKGVHKLIQIMKLIHESDSDFTLVIGGTGPDANYLKEMVRSLDLEENVIFAGYIPESVLASYFVMCDLFLFHSTNETFGIVLVQAMAAGKPIISVKTSAIPEVVVDTVNGYLFDIDDEIGFARKAIELSNDTNEYNRISSQNRSEVVRRYSWDKIASDYENILVEVGT